MSPHSRLIVAAAGSLAFGTAVLAQVTVLPSSQGLAEGVSDNGVVVGSFGVPEYFMWSLDGGWMLIGGVPAGGGVGGQAKVSNDGAFVSGTAFNPDSGLHEMSRYEAATDTWTSLGGLGGSSGTEMSSGWNISGDGQSVVGLGWIDAGDAHAVRWSATDGMVQDLGSTVDGQSTRANGVDLDGNVVVGWQDGAGRQGAVWVNGVQQLIFKDDGSPALEAFDVSGDGRWVTGLGIGGFFDAAIAYRYDSVTDTYLALPNLAEGAESRMAGAGITDDGATIVGGTWGVGPATFGIGLIWREGVGTMRFDEYLDELGIAYPDGYNFNFVSAISSDGQWMTGWGGTGFAANSTFIVQIAGNSCVGDLDGSGDVGFGDLLMVLADWGICDGCSSDLDGSGVVDFVDLLTLLAAWGPCP